MHTEDALHDMTSALRDTREVCLADRRRNLLIYFDCKL